MSKIATSIVSAFFMRWITTNKYILKPNSLLKDTDGLRLLFYPHLGICLSAYKFNALIPMD